MDQEIQALQQELQAIREIVEADHKMIQGIYRRMRVSWAISILKWVLIIGFSIGAFYFIQPMLEQLIGVYTGLGALNSANTTMDPTTLELLKSMIK